MLDIYWGCLIFGIVISSVLILFGDVIGHTLHMHVVEPMTIIGGITVFGGAGVLFSEYSSFETVMTAILSTLIAILMSLILFFLYVRPMKNAENSTSFSLNDLQGSIGEVTVPIPASGYGEVIIKVGVSNTNQIAASFTQTDIQSGSRVVVIEVKDNTLYVSRFE